jgi:predicted enzyme related to lactoylglutathione lyase
MTEKEQTVHRSRLAGFIIDCQTTDLEAAADFWSSALGLPRRISKDPADTAYIKLQSGSMGLDIQVQQVDHPSRVHFDIETDDIDAEVRRLEELGAKRLKQVRTWWVMEAPTGHRFCVVRPQGPIFAKEANRWD